MIIPNDDKKSEIPKAVFEEQPPRDPPPTYTSVQSGPAPPLPVPGPSSYTPSNVVNYVSISRKHADIKEALRVDPSLYIPETFRAPLLQGESESSRKNVRLETIHGQIQAEISLVQDTAVVQTRSPQRATLQLSTIHGGIKLAIPDHPYRPPFLLTAKATSGGIRLALPRSFTGPIRVSYVDGGVKASALGGHFITLSEADGHMKGFIGDLSTYTEYDGEGKGWKGDELVLELRHGSVKLRFYPDTDGKSSTAGMEDPKKSIFSKIFGL